MFKYKRLASVACTVAVLTTCIAVQPVRGAISDALSIFRMDNVKGITISMKDVQEIKAQMESHKGEINLDKMGKIKNTGGEKQVVTPESLKSLTDPAVVFPAVLSDIKPQASVSEPARVEFTLNVDSTNGILKSLGAQKLLPEDINGKTFAVNTSRIVTLNYNRDGKFYTLVQSKSPEIVVPEGVDADELYASLLDLPIIPGNLRDQLKSIKDWKNTLYVPVVESDTREADINGVKGYVQSNENQAGGERPVHSNLIWGSNGVIYTLSGNVTAEELVSVATSMR